MIVTLATTEHCSHSPQLGAHMPPWKVTTPEMLKPSPGVTVETPPSASQPVQSSAAEDGAGVQNKRSAVVIAVIGELFMLTITSVVWQYRSGAHASL